MIEMVDKEEQDTMEGGGSPSASDNTDRVSASVYGPRAEQLRAIASEIKVSTRKLAAAILEYADPGPAIRRLLSEREAEQLRAVEELRKKYSVKG